MSTNQQGHHLSGWGIVALTGFLASIAGIATGVIDVYQFWKDGDEPQPAASNLVAAPRDSTPPAPPPSRAQPPAAAFDITTARLKSAIDLAGVLEVQALRDLNPAPLYRVFANEALKSRMANLDALRSSGSYAVAQRHSITYGPISIGPEGDRAEVQANPVWELRFFSALNHACLARLPAREIPQKLYLERRNDDWMITAILFEQELVENPIPC